MKKYIEIKDISTNLGKLNLRIHTRRGSRSPELWQIHYKDRWITPYEQRKIGLKLTPASLLRMLYRDVNLSSLIYNQKPFMTLVGNDYHSVYALASVIFK